MEIFTPAYYEKFRCLAGACPDSCCQEWDVDVDPASAAYYRSLPGELGDRLRQVLTDTQDGTVMALEEGRCPMWRRDGLCEIQKQLGENGLCQVCKTFPRLRHDYGSFAELGLELSCPEAARLILGETSSHLTAGEEPGAPENPEYLPEDMEILRSSRQAFLEFLDTETCSLPQSLGVLLLYAHQVQGELDGEEPEPLDWKACLEGAKRYAAPQTRPLQPFFLGLEILTPGWKQRLEAPAQPPKWQREHRALLRYLVQRYWLQAVSDLDLVCRVKLMVSLCLLTASLGGDLLSTAQLMSKEIENSWENIDAILQAAYDTPALTDANLLGLLSLR